MCLAVDASDQHVGGVLQQRGPGGWEPLAFFSRKLSDTEGRYSTLDRELLACVSAIRHFRHQVEGRAFYLLTDHKPLTHLVHKVSDAWSARQQRHLAYVAEYTADVRHVPGLENVVADALSRPPAVAAQPPAVGAVVPPASTGPLKWAELAALQATWADLEKWRASSSLQLSQVEVEGRKVWCDGCTGTWRPLVPPELRHVAWASVHGLAHPGVRATCRLMSNKFVWPGLATDCKEWCRQCTSCNKAKVTKQETTAVEKMAIPEARFSHVHVDLVGPLPVTREGFIYLLTMVDRSTRWPEVVCLKNMAAETVLEAFISTWVARFGVPAHVTSDRGTQFTSSTWRAWCEQQGIRHHTTTAFHPQANGMVERFHRQLKDALRARGASTTWADHLPWVLLGLRAAPKEESGVSAGEAALGHQLVLPGQLLPNGPPPGGGRPPRPPAVIPATKRSYAEVLASPSSPLDSARWVYVRRGGQVRPLANNYDGPYQVVEARRKTFTVLVGAREEVISRDRLKPHLGEAEPGLAAPPRRGRPPRTEATDDSSTLVLEESGGPV